MSAYRIALVDRLLCVQWTSRITVEDVQSLEADTLSAYRRLGQRMLNIGVLGPLSVPDAAVRARLEKLVVSTREAIELTVIVIPEEGMMTSLLRTAIRASVMLTGTREQMRIAGSMEEALRIVGPRMSIPTSELLKKLGDAGMLDRASGSARR